MSGMRKYASMLAAIAVLLAARSVQAEDCHYCGECKETKYKLCLVQVHQEVELPIYQCQTQTVFCPTKGIVNHCGRCDNFLRMEKCSMTPMPVVESCGCTSGCNGGCASQAAHCMPPTWSGQIHYQRQYCPKQTCSRQGACPDGQHVCATVSLPTDETCNTTVPVLRWVRVPVCDGCCSQH